jgi:hypothetical protein
MDEKRNEITGNQVDGALCIRFPWPESPELFGETTKDIKKPILLHFRVNILQETAL